MTSRSSRKRRRKGPEVPVEGAVGGECGRNVVSYEAEDEAGARRHRPGRGLDFMLNVLRSCRQCQDSLYVSKQVEN